MKAIIIGGGIVGLSSALYLRRSGWEVTVLDKGDLSDNCSYGNAGYICPSHFVPLAQPGAITLGLKWLLDSRSPFYVKPSLDPALFRWGLQFIRSSTNRHVQDSARPLLDIALLSKACYEDWLSDGGLSFFYAPKGMLELYQTDAAAHHAASTAEAAARLGLEARLLDKEQVSAMEPGVAMNIAGGLYYPGDAHCAPDELMRALLDHLEHSGVVFQRNTAVTGMEISRGVINKVRSENMDFEADQFILAAGSWSSQLAAMAGLQIPMMPGRGYSITLDVPPLPLSHPAILTEGRVAVTPLGNRMRFGGTMEITGTSTPPRYKRMEGILNTIHSFYPGLELPFPPVERIWYGYRPCSADGLPYIGRSGTCHNLTIATGHAMVGLSLGAATGLLVAEIVNEKTPSIDLKPFDPRRFA